MKLSTGKIAFPIEFDNGDKDCIYFNPNDPNLFDRMNKFQSNMHERTSSIDDAELNADGKPNKLEYTKAFQKLQSILYEELDIAFGSEVSVVVFKHCSPFAIVDGEYFITQFINAIIPEIKKHIEKANADVTSKKNKHIAKYTK